MKNLNNDGSPIVKPRGSPGISDSTDSNFDANGIELEPMSTRHAKVTMALIHINMAYLMNSFTVP